MTLDERLRKRGFALERVDGSLALRDLEDPSMSPLVCDFSDPSLLHRLKSVGKNQPLGKALGLKEQTPTVLDATAGLGTDALVMAALGCRVRSVERSDVIFMLLQDGHLRLRQTNPELAERLTFEHADARDVLRGLAEADGASVRPEVVYLDPMYPDEGRSKSALPKKTMQMFRRLLDCDEDAEELWAAAMKAALKRVVVKRPMKAPSLGSKKPTHSFEGKTARFDLYLTT